MILGQSSPPHLDTVARAGRVTLDDMFRRTVARTPGALAIADAPDREKFTDGPPRRLTYAAADRIVSAMAGRLRAIGLDTDQIVGLQLPNTVEGVFTLLGVLRAGLIAAPLPLLWRRADAVTALSQVGAKALITSRRIGSVDHADLAMHVAADIFRMRYICAFGPALPEGLIPLDDVCISHTIEPLPPIERPVNPAAHLAVITWETSAAGLVPVARNHIEVLAAGLSVMIESGLDHRSPIATTLSFSSLAGLATGIVPWLIAGGTLCLHHPFDAEVLVQQHQDHGYRMLIVPGPVAFSLAEAGVLARCPGLRTVVAAWRSPERAAGVWADPSIALVDAHAFGETAVIATRRDSDGCSVPLDIGPIMSPRRKPGAVLVAETAQTEAGTLAVRGAMVPAFAFPPGAEQGNGPFFQVDPNGFVDTGYACRLDRKAQTLTVTAPPGGLVTIGGYQFSLHDLQRLAADAGSTLAVLPDALSGQRLAGHADDRAAVQDRLAALGVNPLIVGAFRGRPQNQLNAA
jgi:non-ribosomal peptide synthetase component E (peptide arylation enzyme)